MKSRDNSSKTMTNDVIDVKGAREHNLCELSLEIPRGQFVVITGVSGSGEVIAGLRYDLCGRLPQVH